MALKYLIQACRGYLSCQLRPEKRILLNTPLLKQRAQQRWLENTLATAIDERLRVHFLTQEHMHIRNGLGENIMLLPTQDKNYLMSMFLGVFEPQVHELLAQVKQKKYQAVVNIGSAEGYYAVLMAKLWPQATVQAYDIKPEMQQRTLALAKLNKADSHMEISGLFHFQDPAAYPNKPSLFLIDIEGCEREMLDVPHLFKQHDMILEMHEGFISDIDLVDQFTETFGNTHQITIKQMQDLDFAKYGNISELTSFEAGLLTFDNRAIKTSYMLLEAHR